jgi:hypothetical protein
MTHIHRIQTTLAMAALLALPLANAATMSKDDYKAGKDTIAATYKADKAACESQSGNAKDICMEEAKGKEKVAKAELEYGHSGKPKDQKAIGVAKADAAYAVAKEKCDDLSGNAKDVCVTQAKAQHTRGLADAKMASGKM